MGSFPGAVESIFGVPNLVTTVWMTDAGQTYTLQDKPVDVSPSELTLQFNANQYIQASSLGTLTTPEGIIVTTTNAAGQQTLVPLGYIGLGSSPNEVVLRFANTLTDGTYNITVVGQSGYEFNGATVNPLENNAGITYHDGYDQQTPPQSLNTTVSFTLDLGPQVSSVVPQPVTRAAVTTLTLVRRPHRATRWWSRPRRPRAAPPAWRRPWCSPPRAQPPAEHDPIDFTSGESTTAIMTTLVAALQGVLVTSTNGVTVTQSGPTATITYPQMATDMLLDVAGVTFNAIQRQESTQLSQSRNTIDV